jgi:NitT/TauT family transport system substrate-binding protein
MALVILLALGISAGSSRADNLKIGYGAFSLGYALIWITKEGQLFYKNGLDVDVLYLESNLVRTALISGDVPIGAMSGAAMATPRLQGADLVVVLGFQNYLPFRLVVRPEIKSVADLKGKRVGVAGFGLLAERAARLVVAKLGLNPDKDVTLLQTGGEATRFAALVNGSIDATVLNPPVHKRAVEAGNDGHGEYGGDGNSVSELGAGDDAAVYRQKSGRDAALDQIVCRRDSSH